MEVNLDDVTVGRRIIILYYDDVRGSIIGIDSTDTIYDSFDEAYKEICSIIHNSFGGITNETIDDRYRGTVTFKQEHQNENNDGHGMTFEVYRNESRVGKYAILPIIANKLHIMTYRGMFIEHSAFGKVSVYNKDKKLITIKKSLDLALAFIDTYLLINPK